MQSALRQEVSQHAPRAGAPPKDSDACAHRDCVDEDDSIPVTVLELSAPPSPQPLPNGHGSPSTSIGVEDDAGDAKRTPARKRSEDNDTSWGKIKTRTAPFVKASAVLMYLAMAAMFVFGWVSLNSCTANPLIPVYLVVAGSTGILTRALIHTRNQYLFNFLVALVVFDLCWQAFGSYSVYSVYQPRYDPKDGEPYCHRVAYLLAFWIITIVYTLIGLFVLLSACYFLMRDTFRKARDDGPE